MGAAVNALPGGEIVAAMDRGLLDAAGVQQHQLRQGARLPRRREDLHAEELAPERRSSSRSSSTRQSTTRCRTSSRRSSPTPSKRVADMSWKAIDRYSKDYIELQKMGVKFYATPQTVLNDQLKVWDEIVAKKESENPMFKKVNESMRAFAERATKWQYDTNNDFRVAVNHYFGQKAAPKKA
jgi:hypothetical protein